MSRLSTLSRSLVADQVARYEARHKMAGKVASILGFRVYNKYLSWINDSEVEAAWKGFPASNGPIADRKYVLYSMARAIANLPGDTAECGAYTGGSSYLICLATQSGDSATEVSRRHYVFDSFEGLSTPSAADESGKLRVRPWQQNDLSVGAEAIKRNLRRFDRVEYLQGWIPSQFSVVADRSFALVHVDVDLYEPTSLSLRFFYERLVPGGFLVCDDYGSERCPGATRAFDELAAENVEARVVHLTTGQGFIVKR